MAIGIPIGFSLIVSGAIGIYAIGGFDAFKGLLASNAFSAVNSFTLTTLPMFILMAYFIEKSRIAEELYASILKWIGHIPGGVGVSTVGASAGFGALSGSSLAAVSIMSKITIPQMIKAKYSEGFSAGLVATCTGTLAALIPPSIPLILYAIQTETPIASLLIAGIIPGILLTILVSIYIVIITKKNDPLPENATWVEKFRSLKSVWPMITLVLIILIVIYSGVATTTEAAAVGALGAFIIGIVMKRLNREAIIESLKATAQQTSMIFIIVLGSTLFGYFITLTGLTQGILRSVAQAGLSPYIILTLIIIMYLILGLFLDLIGSMLLTLPIVFPIISALGFDPIWFGVVVVLLLEIGLVTPPVGINLFVVSEQSGISVKNVFLGALPFIGILLLLVLLIVMFPQLVLFLPTSVGLME